jgi:hypothetical protein
VAYFLPSVHQTITEGEEDMYLEIKSLKLPNTIMAFISLTVLFFTPITAAAQVESNNDSSPESSIQIVPAQARPGQIVSATGSCAVNGDGRSEQDVRMFFEGETWTTIRANNEGNFRSDLTIPQDAKAGAVTIRGECSESEAVFEGEFTVLSQVAVVPENGVSAGLGGAALQENNRTGLMLALMLGSLGLLGLASGLRLVKITTKTKK